MNKGDKSPTELLKADVVVGGDGLVTPTGTFTAKSWEKDHVSTLYGSAANKPWSKTTLGGNAFGPFQLHIQELDGRASSSTEQWGRAGVRRLGAMPSFSAQVLTGAYACATVTTSSFTT